MNKHNTIQEIDWTKAKDFFSKNLDKITTLFNRVSDKYKSYIFRYIKRISQSPIVRFTPPGETFVLKIPMPSEVVTESKRLYYDSILENNFVLTEEELHKGLGSIAGSLNEFFVLEKIADATAIKWGQKPKDITSPPPFVNQKIEILLSKLKQSAKRKGDVEQTIKKAELGSDAVAKEIMQQLGDTCRITEYWWTGDIAAKTGGRQKEDISFRVIKEGIDEELIKKYSLKLSSSGKPKVNLQVTTLVKFLTDLEPQVGKNFDAWFKRVPEAKRAFDQYDFFQRQNAFINKLDAEAVTKYKFTTKKRPKVFSLSAPPTKKPPKKKKVGKPVEITPELVERIKQIAKFYSQYPKDKFYKDHTRLTKFEYDKTVPASILNGVKVLEQYWSTSPPTKFYSVKNDKVIREMEGALEKTRKLASAKMYQYINNDFRNFIIDRLEEGFNGILKNPAMGNEFMVDKLLEITGLSDESTETLLAIVKKTVKGQYFDKLVKVYPYLHMRGLHTERPVGKKEVKKGEKPQKEKKPNFDVLNSDNQPVFNILYWQSRGLLVNFYYEQPKGKKVE